MFRALARGVRGRVVDRARRPAVAALIAGAAGSAAGSSACESKPKSHQEIMVRLQTGQRTIFLSGTIDDDSAKLIIAALLYLDQESSRLQTTESVGLGYQPTIGS